ncbi:hypothetical protein ACFWTE_08390 [Nocardiopsis sp. NPDC058631]|uniref:hypothetical protein n=1 Tax=Nocardiopsis sp. NPDC058631 TaxID=3346566 RepID=UPI00365EDE5C
MTVTEAGSRVASGGGIHASLLLLLPWSISSDVRPAVAFAVLLVSYVALLAITTLPSLAAFLWEKRRSSTKASPHFEATKTTSAAVAGFFYFALPISLVFTEDSTALVAAISMAAFAMGFLVHRMCLYVSFSGVPVRVFCPIVLSIPVLGLLIITWPF